ncbi:hypothetical protein [Caldivirga maquilingensis]|uniref:Uncharacterized protein n=1 Tax=Caldivirga maquilingensis (strain ATCC 700844 / DSM 13496 / JCM 10307 / IC-167) TaxID=397948 RepID=A8MDE1_CALMQ|nr:hypothetical protein [Caldivirga maquilingensis]ABW01797.1 hypothetical protein Cmaq_0965 [Caldivirga maquilingensis IC-167]
MSNDLGDIKGSVKRLRERVSSGTFIKAVGKGTVRDIETLIEYYELTKSCVMLTQDEAKSLYNLYVASEGRIKKLLEGFLETMITIKSRDFAAIYPFMPSDVKELLKPLLSSNTDEGIKEVLGNVLSNLNLLGSVLLNIAKREPGDVNGCVKGNCHSTGSC